MAKKAKKTARGRKQDRARVAGGQDYDSIHGQKDRTIESCREEGSQEGWLGPKARRAQTGSIDRYQATLASFLGRSTVLVLG
jgi:hypothetical protein